MVIAELRGEVRKNEPLSRHTSFGIGGPADILAFPADRDDLIVLLHEVAGQGVPYFVLGGGTNLLVRDSGFRGAAISLRRMNAVRIEREYQRGGDSFVVVIAEAGAFLPKLLSFAAEEGLGGLEFAAGIPGTVGGAVRMNAGASGGEIGDVIESVGLLTPGGGLLTKSREEMGFGYRTSSIPDNHLVLDARLILRRDDGENIKGRMKELLDARKERQPRGFPNAGSIFKNPPGEAAGRLIESAGLKGTAIGGAQVSEKHANFIVNRGGATARDVLELMALVKKKVSAVHGITLEPEIRIIGDEG